jgi:tetratricopeptide (TPR) repeat protein
MSDTDQNVSGNTVQPAAVAGPKTPRPARISAKRKWLFRFVAIVLGPAIAFGILELSLRAAGYGFSTNFFIDGTKMEESPVWVENSEFGRWVFPNNLESQPAPLQFIVPKEKSEKSYRIFVLGESAAKGFPDPSISFARVLEVMLRASFPAIRFEITNCSMVAINSHAVLQIARQCAEHKPDLFIVHLGNNEVVGPYGAAGVLGAFSPNIGLIRANHALKRARTGQLIDDLVQWISRGKKPKQVWKGMGMFLNSQLRADDPRLNKIYSHFRTNLQDIIRAGRDAGAQVVVCTIPVNLKDCAPFGSMHASDLNGDRLEAWEKLFKEGARLQSEKKYAEAIRNYGEAEAIDATFAELAYRRAQCSLAIGETDAARASFARARDLDALRFRTDSTINNIIREVASAQQADGVRLVDAEKGFAQSDAAGIPGEDVFLEHVHMTFKGNYLLGKQIYEAITKPAVAGLGQPAEQSPTPLSERQASEKLAHTDWFDLKNATDMYERLIQAAPFTFQFDHAECCLRWEKKLAALKARQDSEGMDKTEATFQTAVKSAKSDWVVRKLFGDLLFERGKYGEAEHEYREVVILFRHNWDAQCQIAGIALLQNNFQAAEKGFREVLRYCPQLDLCHLGLADALDRQGKGPEAVSLLEGFLRDNPNNVDVVKMIGRILVRAGKIDEAKARFTKALEADPNNADYHAELGLIARQQKNIDEAIDHFKAALQIRPDWPEVTEFLHAAEKDKK